MAPSQHSWFEKSPNRNRVNILFGKKQLQVVWKNNSLQRILIISRLESLCNSDNGKVRLRLGDLAATFQLNSSLVPELVFNCHLELAVESSSFGNSFNKFITTTINMLCYYQASLYSLTP